MAEEDYQRISGFEKNFTEFVVDPLYGSIGLTAEEKRITDSPLFRRLKRIKQLGLVSEFYNGASHTRFDHSLGTLHITWAMFRRFVDNLRYFNAWTPTEGILHLFSDETIKALRITALIHDLGHGPYSHYFDGISEYMNAHVDHDKISPFLVGDKEFQKEKFEKYYNAVYTGGATQRKVVKAQKELLECLPSELIFRKKILCIMEPNYTSTQDNGFNQAKEFLHDLVYGDVGSDRIDYLLRDTHFTGLGHRFNLNDLVNNIAAIYDEDRKKVRFAITEEGEDVLDFFLTTRYYHYRLIADKMENIDQFAQLKERVENWIRPKKNKLSIFIKLTLEDEVHFERTIPQLDSWNFERIGAWRLGQIRADYDRFLVYRLLTDRHSKQEYLNATQQKLSKDASQSLRLALNPSDLRIECIEEKPRIPIIPVYRSKYSEMKTSPKEEKDKLSSLIHDDSEMVMGLARTYVAHTTVIVYSNRIYAEKVKEYIQKTFSFFVDPELFRSVLRSEHNNISRLDIMFGCLYCINKYQIESAAEGKIPLPKETDITTLNKFFKFLEQIQNEFIVKESDKEYNFQNKEGYNPEERKCYPYPPKIINDLIPCEYSGLVRISKENRYINKWDKGAVPQWAMSYGLNFPKHAEKNFEIIMSWYPKEFQEKLEKIYAKGFVEKGFIRK